MGTCPWLPLGEVFQWRLTPPQVQAEGCQSALLEPGITWPNELGVFSWDVELKKIK